MNKKITINTEYVKYNDIELRYGFGEGYVGFTIVSSPNDGRQQVIRTSTCRDYLHERIHDYLGDVTHAPEERPRIDFKRLRLLLVVDDTSKPEVKANIFNAKRVLNMYEKMAGWKNQSKISSADIAGPYNAFLITGSGEWMSHPVLLSMVTLILRIGMKFGPLPSAEKELVEKWKQICAEESTVDSDYLEMTYEYFPILMKKYTELFETKGPEAFKLVGHYNGGIVALSEGKGYDKELYKRLLPYR